MPDAPKAELMRSLGRVVRGLSALFWGLPLALVVYVQTARTDWLDFFGMFALVPAVIVSGMVCYALGQLRHFQKQERIWQQALYRAEMFALVNLGLAPFLYWWHRMPSVPLYSVCTTLLAMCSILLLIQINRVLQRLTAMLPDEMIRSETKMFSSLNITLLAGVFGFLCLYFGLLRVTSLPRLVYRILAFIGTDGIWMLLFLILMPLAMTMAMVWKVKEVIFASVFDAEH